MFDCSSLFYYIIYCFFSGKENAAFDVIIKAAAVLGAVFIQLIFQNTPGRE